MMERPCVSFPKRSASCHALSHKAPKNVFIDGGSLFGLGVGI